MNEARKKGDLPGMLRLNGHPLTLTTLKHIAPYHYAYHLSSIRHPHLIERFDRYMHDNPEVIRALHQSYNIP